MVTDCKVYKDFFVEQDKKGILKKKKKSWHSNAERQVFTYLQEVLLFPKCFIANCGQGELANMVSSFSKPGRNLGKAF